MKRRKVSIIYSVLSIISYLRRDLSRRFFGTRNRNRTCNYPLGGGCYIHLTMQAYKGVKKIHPLFCFLLADECINLFHQFVGVNAVDGAGFFDGFTDGSGAMQAMHADA